jgi:hypothetical protein
MSTDPDRARTLRRRHMRERQAVIFGTLLAGLALTGLASAAIYTGTLHAPFLARGFSSPPPTDAAAPPPCPPGGATPVPYGQVTVNVFNGSGRLGIAGQTATALKTRGFTIGTTGNAPAPVSGTAYVRFGAAGVAAAYTLAAHVGSSVLVLDTRSDPTVDLMLGEGFVGLVTATQVTLDPAVPFTPPPGCVLLAQATPVPAPVSTPGATTGTSASAG